VIGPMYRNVHKITPLDVQELSSYRTPVKKV
jgi:hypothetical protein